ncbi:MAG TPA: alkaline phosphatase D family protein, partial [Myxococcota bacterium]|nr:alkaline phosphatase D family protein [Myxococcota bacterium]
MFALPTLGCKPDDDLPADGFPAYTWDGPLGPATTFQHGVASGDPLADAVLLWTRVSPGAGTSAAEVEVFLEVSRAPDFAERVAVGTFTTSAEADWTLTVDQIDLDPATTYYYRFSALGRTSPIGRTRTLTSGALDRARFAVCSCSNFAAGYFYAYRHMANRPDLDFFIHLGDYIYEHASAGNGFSYGVFRELQPPNEVLTLDDYRARYAWYRTDPDLQELHRQHPMLHCWDDHEFADNPRVGGSENHTEGDEGAWSDRVAAALRAYHEWIPSRLDGDRIYREAALGDLARLVFTDRQRRFLWPEPDDGERYLGAAQTSWLADRVASVTEPWLILCTGTSFTARRLPGSPGLAFDGEPWDDTSRREVLDMVAGAGVENLLVLVGDIHKSQALDVADDVDAYDPTTGAGSEGVEFACGSITSPGLAMSTEGVPYFHWSDNRVRSYLLVDLTRDRVQGEFWGFEDARKTDEALPDEALLKAFTCAAGSHHLVETTTPTAARDAAAPAP